MSQLWKRVPCALYRCTPKNPCAFLVLVTVLFAESCSGLSNTSGSGPGQANAVLVLALRAVPLPAGTTVNLLSFRTTVASISLTAATGGSVNVPLNSEPYEVDLTRLQSDSTLLAVSNSIPDGTYTNMVVSLSDPAVTYCRQGPGGSGCAQGSIVTLSGAPATPVITASPFPLTFSRGQVTGLSVTVDIAKALTVNEQTQAITELNLGAFDVLTAMALPPRSSSLLPGAQEFIEDVTGIVSSVDESTQTLTIQTATKGSISATAGASTAVSPNCIAFNLGNTFSCAKPGQVASVDAILNTDGSVALLEYDPLAVQEGNWIEGVISIPPLSSTQFQLVTNDLIVVSRNDLLASNLKFGDPVLITLANPKPFVVDSKGLVTASSILSGATDASVLSPGETLSVHVVSFAPATGTALATASVDFVYLRFTRVTGIVANSAPPNSFSIQTLPSFFGLNFPVTVQLSNLLPGTSFDGVSGAAELVPGQVASIRALYFGAPTGPTPTPSPFSAAKVRVH